MQLYLEICWIYWDFFQKNSTICYTVFTVRNLTVPETEFHNFSSPGIELCVSVAKANEKWIYGLAD